MCRTYDDNQYLSKPVIDEKSKSLLFLVQGWMQDFGKGGSFWEILSKKHMKLLKFHQNPRKMK